MDPIAWRLVVSCLRWFVGLVCKQKKILNKKLIFHLYRKPALILDLICLHGATTFSTMALSITALKIICFFATNYMLQNIFLYFYAECHFA